MNEKILLGCIIAVAILVGVSLTSVIGYQSIESNFKESPLFNIRSSRALDEDIWDFNSDFIGRCKTNNLVIPKKHQYDILISKFYDRFKIMDDEEFDRFINIYITNSAEYYKLNKNDIILLVEILKFSRYNPNIIKYIINPTNQTQIDHNTIKEPDWYPGLCFLLNFISFIQKVTHKHDCTILNIWLPGCIPMNILEIILGIIDSFIMIIRSFIPFGCMSFDCPPH
jgi:hypothetical protein